MPVADARRGKLAEVPGLNLDKFRYIAECTYILHVFAKNNINKLQIE